MSDTEKKPENEDPNAELPEASSHPVAELEEIPDRGELEDLDAPSDRTPSLKELFKTPDSPSRYLLIFSFFLIIAAATCLILFGGRYWKHRHSVKNETIASPVLKLEPTFQVKLGEFKVSLSDGELRVDLVVQCGTQIACDELAARKIDARDRVLPILQNSSRSEILNSAKKQVLRQQITDSLNAMKLSGKIIEVNFSDLTVEIGH